MISRGKAMIRERNYGIDLLRIVATFMIIILHILGVGGVIYNAKIFTPVYITAWLLEFGAYCAVNCYALISGYVGIYSKFRISNILLLWMQVVFTTLIITVVFYFLGADVTITDIKEACTPVTSQLYWYFTAYVALYLLSPFLNQLVISLSDKWAKYFLLIAMILFSIVPTFWEKDLYFVNYGYSAAWLIILYLVGGIIRKYYSQNTRRKRILLVGYILNVLFTLFTKLGIEYLVGRNTFSMFGSNFLMNYNSPTIVFAAICLLLLFANLNVKKYVKPIAFLAPVTFGVYIIHSHPIIWDEFMANRFVGYVNLHPIILVGAVLLTALVIFLICSFIDYVRIKVFNVLHVFYFCKNMDDKITAAVKKIRGVCN